MAVTKIKENALPKSTSIESGNLVRAVIGGLSRNVDFDVLTAAIGGSPLATSPVENEYADITELLANQSEQTATFFQYVLDASDDPNITSGDAYYEKLTPTSASLSDYRLLSDTETEVILSSNSYRVFKIKVIQDDTTPITSVSGGKISFEYNTGSGLVTAVVFNKIYTDAIENFIGLDVNLKFYNRSTKEYQRATIGSGDWSTVGTHYSKALVSGTITAADLSVNDRVENFIDFESIGGGVSTYNVDTVTTNKTITASDESTINKVTALANIVLPNDTTENLPIGFRTLVKKSTASIVSFFGQSGVVIETPEDFLNEVDGLFNAIELVKEGANNWGVYGSLVPTTEEVLLFPLVVQPSQTSLDDLAWSYPHKSSDFPTITTTKDYFVIYSTDHIAVSADGKIMWGEMDDLEYNGFVELGEIVGGFQAEFAQLILIPTAESGLGADTVFLYYHTDSTDPSNTINQETHLLTTTGGLLHTATWNQQGRVLGVVAGDDHTGYLRIWKRGVSDYIGHHVITGGGSLPHTDQQQVSTSTDGLIWTRGDKYSLDDNMTGSITFWRHDVQPFTWEGTLYGIIRYDDTTKFVGLFTLDTDTYLPTALIKELLEDEYADLSGYLENDIMYIYLRGKNTVQTNFPITSALYLYKFDLNEII